jgi:hypothetical protein
LGPPVFARMRERYTPQEIVEAILAIGFYMTMARLTEATETDLDPAAGMALFDRGKKPATTNEARRYGPKSAEKFRPSQGKSRQ